jgi:RNA polymerase sigma-70 factor (ECF subfamily)
MLTDVTLSDNDLLLEFARSRSPSLFDELDRRFRQRLDYSLWSYVRCQADRDDVVQLTLLMVWRNARQFNGQSAAFTWICRIGINQVISLQRRQSAKVRRCVRNGLDLELYSAPAAPEVQQPDLNDMAEVTAAVQRLSPPLKSVVELTELREMRYQEAADITIRSRLHRAMKRLREMIIGEAG